MVETIRVDEETVSLLRQLKGSRSYNDVIRDMIRKTTKPGELTELFIAEMEAKYGKRKKENISEHIDEIVYGVARP